MAKLKFRSRDSIPPIILIVSAVLFIISTIIFLLGKNNGISANTNLNAPSDSQTQTMTTTAEILMEAGTENPNDINNMSVTDMHTDIEYDIVNVPTTDPLMTTEPPDEPQSTTQDSIDTTDNPEVVVSVPSETETNLPEVVDTTQPETEPPTEYDPNNTVEGDYTPYMLENLIEIVTDDENDTHITVEKPPSGRDTAVQAKIIPVNQDIPNPQEYFKDIIFLGDSVTTGFDLFRDYIKFNGERVMTDVTVVAAKSYGIYNATREISDKSVHPLLNGEQALPEDIIAEKEGTKVFICLGLNDVSWQSPNTYLQNYAELINRIRKKSPNKTVAILAITPLTFEGQKESLTNEKIMEFNNMLIEFAAYNNIPFIDYAAAIRDSANNLYPNLSSDNYCHIVLSAYNRLTEYLLYHPID